MSEFPRVSQNEQQDAKLPEIGEVFREIDILQSSVEVLQQNRSQEVFDSLSFLAPEIQQGPLSFDGFSAVNSQMEQNNQLAMVHTKPCEWAFNPETRSRIIARLDPKKNKLNLDGELYTEISQPFIGDKVLDFRGTALLYDSRTGIGLSLHKSDVVQLYRSDMAELLDAEMMSEHLKELVDDSERRNAKTNALFVKKRDAHNTAQNKVKETAPHEQDIAA
jgi:hypothetical protein